MFQPSILKCPTGKYIWVGTIYEELEGKTFATREKAQDAWNILESMEMGA